MRPPRGLVVDRDGVSLQVTDRGGEGPPLLLLHGLAGSSQELLPTADVLVDSFHVYLLDQRGHGASTRRPHDLSREAFVDDVVAVIEQCAPGERWTLVGQSMGAHTAMLVAAARPELVDRLVMLEGHAAGNDDPGEAQRLGRYLASWPLPFADAEAARDFLGGDAIAGAWIADLECADHGLMPRFDADIMERTLAAVHEPRWQEWETLNLPTLVVFGASGMFTADQRQELLRRRQGADCVVLNSGTHDAHLDAFDEWVEALRSWLVPGC